MFSPSHIKNYIITGLVSNFFMHIVKGWHLLCKKEITISVSNFYMKTINIKHTLLYNLATIHSIQRYNGLCELTKQLLTIFLWVIQHAAHKYTHTFIMFFCANVCWREHFLWERSNWILFEMLACYYQPQHCKFQLNALNQDRLKEKPSFACKYNRLRFATISEKICKAFPLPASTVII